MKALRWTQALLALWAFGLALTAERPTIVSVLLIVLGLVLLVPLVADLAERRRWLG